MVEQHEDDEREVELSSIAAIFPELVRDASTPFSASIALPVSPASPLDVVFPIAEDGGPPASDKLSATIDTSTSLPSPAQSIAPPTTHEVHHLEHLPPLQLRITLPDGYPTESPPIFTLTTSPAYLPQDTLSRLVERGEILWEECGRSQTVFTYIDFLQQSAELAFDLAGSQAGTTLELPDNLKIKLLDYDIAEKKRRFEQETFDCGVCLEPKKGLVCYRLQKCRHVFCVACLQDFYNNCVNEGDVASVKCVDPTCGRSKGPQSGQERARKRKSGTLSPSELLQIPLERPVVMRYVQLRRKKKLESDKSTIYCPRKWCQGPARSKKHPKVSDLLALDAYDSGSDAENEGDDPANAATGGAEAKPTPAAIERLAICEDCTFAFCRVCLASWHGDYVRCWPRSEAELSAEEKASYDYIRTHTSPCPTCSSPCQKTHGCNHMNCFQCHSHFCYLCSSWLDPQNPYQHFNKKELGCYMRLWELEEGDEGQGNERFVGARGWEAAVLAADQADADERREADGAPPGQQQQQQHPLPDVNLVDDGLAAGLQNLAMDEAPRPRFRMPPRRPQARQQQQQPQPLRDALPDLDHGLQRFLEMVQRDEEDGWDSDEMGDDDEFWIPER